jgi:hypothetical protein
MYPALPKFYLFLLASIGFPADNPFSPETANVVE